MAKVLSSISGNLISAASAGFAPTNSADVSAIASGYQVVSATATQLYAGTAFLTSVNGDPISASRAGNAANASMATSAYYDGTGRLISALPDSAAVSSIASSYQVVSATAGDGTYVTSINGMGLSGQGGGGGAQVVTSTGSSERLGTSYVSEINGSGISATVARLDSNGRDLAKLVDSATVSSIASSYQVVTATGSASATAGWFPFTTSYLVSSINGSAILPYGYSALSGNSANWNNARTAVTANSANWNSVYNTVSSNSASWSGSTGGGSVTSPSGTIMVMNGNEVEGTNSAILTADGGEGFEQLLHTANQQLSQTMQPLTYDSVPGTGATLMMPLSPATYMDIRVILSGRDTGYVYTSASGIIPSGVSTASIPMDGITGLISASAEQWIGLAGDQLTAKKEGGILVTGVGELAWKSAVDNVTNTVSSNSATWGQGGVDSATVSSIASSYAESAVSSKQDSSAMSAYALSSNVSGVIDTVSANSASWSGGGTVSVDSNMSGDGYNTPLGLSPVVKLSASGSAGYVYIHGGSGSFTVSGNTARFQGTGKNTMNVSFNCDPDKKAALFIGPWVASNNWAGVSAQYTAGNINMNIRASGSGSAGLTLWDSAGSAQMQKSSIPYWDGKLDSSASSSFYTTANESGFIDSAYVDSAVSGKADSSALSSYALSADVSGTVDLVSTQSANWGGSALALSAGPGVRLEKVGDTLVAGLDETVLWSGSSAASVNTVFTLGESYTNFERIRLSLARSTTQMPTIQEFYVGGASTTLNCMIPIVDSGAGSTMYIDGVDFGLTDQSTFTVLGITRKKLASTALTTESDKPLTLFKIVGINRTANN